MSSSGVILYESEDGTIHLNVRLEDETAWLTQADIADLFQSGKANISEHISHIFEEGELTRDATVRNFRTVQSEGKRQVERNRDFYNLDLIIAVGYRVNSKRATLFRIWATNIIKEYIIKGFVLNDARMKTGNNMPYFDELQARIRDIRLSERVFYQKVKDIYTTSVDYDPHAEKTTQFFKVVQNKLLWAISKQTAAELVSRRANAHEPFMGMLSYDKQKEHRITLQDAQTGKNYLTHDEMLALGLLVEQYLAFAEAQAQQQVAMTMSDWISKLDGILTLNGRELLTHAGSISSDLARQIATIQLEKLRLRLANDEYEKSLDELTRDLNVLANQTLPQRGKRP